MNPLLHLRRIWALGSNTFTQLVRMRVFYFLFFFALAILVVGFLVQSFDADRTRELRVVKDLAFFAMSVFGSIFAVAATANLLPKDIEDRTLYTILAKPVPRWEYLLGKYLGVLIVAGLSVLVMTALLYGVLAWRQTNLLQAELAGANAEDIPHIKAMIGRDGVRWELAQGSLAVFLQSSVLAALTLLISTFASSGLFTIIIAIFVYFIGFGQPVVVEYWREAGVGGLGSFVLRLFEVLFPNFQSFNLVDGIVAGESLPGGTLAKISGIAFSYVAIYLALAYLFFAKKEL